MRKSLLAAALLLFCSTILATGSENLRDLLAAAKQGNPTAQLNYAKAIFNTSQTEAFVWAKKAGNKGLAEAWYWLGENTTGKTSLDYYAKAAQMGYAAAYIRVIDANLFAGKDADYAKAKEFTTLARQKNILVGMDANDSKEKMVTVDRCLAAGKPIIPKSDLPSQKERKLYRNHDCLDYQFGIGVKTDLRKYRLCLLSQQDTDNTLLAEVYANGWGVRRNPNLATALICYADNLAPAELTGMVNVLYHSKQTKSAKPFQFCENITSGFNMSVCAAQDEKINAYQRHKKLEQMTANWPAKDRLALQKLLVAAKVFFKTHAENEQDMSGTAHGAIAIGEETALNNQLVTDLQRFESGKLPKDTDIKRVDHLQTEVFKKLMQLNYEDNNMGTLTKQGIRETERKWLQYKEAWVHFGVQRYPTTSANAWRVWITLNRIEQLKAILELG